MPYESRELCLRKDSEHAHFSNRCVFFNWIASLRSLLQDVCEGRSPKSTINVDRKEKKKEKSNSDCFSTTKLLITSKIFKEHVGSFT